MESRDYGRQRLYIYQEEMEKQRTALGNDMDDLARHLSGENYNNVWEQESF